MAILISFAKVLFHQHVSKSSLNLSAVSVPTGIETMTLLCYFF